MKKYITTLAVMAFAIAGCTESPELTGDTTGEKQKPVGSEEDLNKKREGGADPGGDADATDPSKGGEKK